MPAWCAKAARAPRSRPSSTRRRRWPAGSTRPASTPRDDALLLRRSIDAQGKSRAWINGSPATVAQLREAAEQLVDIHGQHAWQSLTRPAAVRALLDEQAGVDTAALAALWQAWKRGRQRRWPTRARAGATLRARARAPGLADRRGRQARARRRRMGRAERRAPAPGACAVAARRRRSARWRRCPKASRQRRRAGRPGHRCAGRAWHATTRSLAPVLEVLQGAQAQLQDAAHTPACLPAPHRARPGSAWPSWTRGCRPGCRWRGATGARRPSCRRCWRGWKQELQRRSTPPPTWPRSSAAQRQAAARHGARKPQRVGKRAAPRRPSWPAR